MDREKTGGARAWDVWPRHEMPIARPQPRRTDGRHRPRRRRRPGEIVAMCLCPLAFVVTGVAVESSARWEAARSTLRQADAELSIDTKRGRILGILERGDTDVALRRVVAEQAPSSLSFDPAETRDEPLVISVFAEDEALNDPETGILSNQLERGREWERPAYVSYFRYGELVHASRVGLRRHGGVARRRDNRVSWRLYFRGEYVSDIGPATQLFDLPPGTDRMVVRKIEPMIPNVLAFEIARRNGALAPASAPARLIFNGEDEGHYLISEHVNPDGWGMSHHGHSEFSMFIYKGMRSTDDESLERYHELEDWVLSAPKPMSMEEAAERVDLDNFVRHMATFFFAGTVDWAQGAAIRDNSRPDATWSFVHWDLDHSFRDPPGWRLPAIDTVLRGGRPGSRNGVRARLMSRLLEEDPEFRRYFADLLAELLDQRMNAEFLTDLLDRYAHLLQPRRLVRLREFFANRPALLRSEIRDLVESRPSAHRPDSSAQ